MDPSGERFWPESADPYDEIAAEHLQRYHSILELVRGKAVLDAGSGEGYGAHLLAATSKCVFGIDASAEAVRHASLRYLQPNLSFLAGLIEALPFHNGAFDVVVAFEVIEHVAEDLQTAFLHEARRVLRPDGILVISTPNKAVYTDAAHQRNPFHKREFHIGEFEGFLKEVFPRVALFGQGWFLSSVIEKTPLSKLASVRLSDEKKFSPKYIVAVCGATESVDAADIASVLIDRRERFEALSDRILKLQEEVSEKDAWAAALQSERDSFGRRIIALQEEVSEKNAWAAALQEEVHQKNSWALGLDRELANVRQRVVELQAEVEDRNAWALSLNADLESTRTELEHMRSELESIRQSDFYKVATRYWRLRDSLLPYGSRRRRLMHNLFALLKSGNAGAEQPSMKPDTLQPLSAAPREYPRIEFPDCAEPRVSIIIPAFNQWDHTYRCLASVRRTTEDLACEVILADDGSTDETVRAAEFIRGVRILRDGVNRGFLRNCNRAAASARGEYLYFLNNDAELKPGAAQSLVALLDSDETIGVAGSKLVYPNGRLQEAGGILWNDASGWNYGRGQDPALPSFNYVKDVDYVSGASLMIRRKLWEEIGGFDDRFAPAYCEDSDLAFEVRKRGRRVVYQPRSVVIHHEGSSHGTDISEGVKAGQTRNLEILRSKWASELAAHFPNGQDVFHARDRSAAKKTVLIIDHYVPHFDRDAGSRTMRSFIDTFLAMGLNVKFLGDNFFPHQPYTEMLEQAGVEVLVGPWIAGRWLEWIRENGRHLDYALLSRPHIAPKYVQPLRSHARSRLLYYVHDLHFLRERESARLRNDASMMERAENLKAEETRLMSSMDAILSCSDAETEILRELCPAVKVYYVPPYAVSVDRAREFDALRRRDILFVGGFSHPPNTDGILWFVHEVWPAIRARLPGVVFHIAGADPPPEIRALASESVRLLGFVSDDRLKKLYDGCRLVVIPLRYGAGVKGKTVEAMAHGVPFVTTRWGVEGMPGIREILDPVQVTESLADSVVALYEDPTRLEEISRRGRDYVAVRFNRETIASAFQGVFQDLEGR